MAVTARSVVYMMAITVTFTQSREFLCLARKYTKRLLGGFENGVGDISDASKIDSGDGFGRGYPSRSMLNQFWN